MSSCGTVWTKTKTKTRSEMKMKQTVTRWFKWLKDKTLYCLTVWRKC